ncbi:MAG: DMT family transporter [Pseudomonadota bacterium]
MLAFSLLVSLSFSLGHLIANQIAPAALMTLRFALASLVMIGVVRVFGVAIAPVFARFWRFLLIGGCMAVYFITMFEALRLTTAVSTATMFTLSPLLAAGFGYLLLSQRTSLATFTALSIGALGAVWVIFRADLGALLRFEIGRGEAIFAIGAVAHGAVPVLSRKLLGDVTPLQAALGTTVGALIVSGAYGFSDLVAVPFESLPAQVWLVLLYLAVVTTAVTFFLVQYASKRLPGSKVMAYTYLVPSWVVMWDLAFNGARPAPAILLGIGCTIVALIMLLRDEEFG